MSVPRFVFLATLVCSIIGLSLTNVLHAHRRNDHTSDVRTWMVGLVALAAGCKANLVGSCMQTAEVCQEVRGDDEIKKVAPAACPFGKFREGVACPSEHVIATCTLKIGPIESRIVYYEDGVATRDNMLDIMRRTCDAENGTLDTP